MRILAAILLLIAAWVSPGLAQPMGQDPPMGWSSRVAFGCSVSEAGVRAATDALVSTGLRDAGYRLVLLDDCWQGARDGAGRLTADPVAFPSGIKALADYVHGRRMRFGLSSSAGVTSCRGRVGGAGQQVPDAATFAGWGVDYLQYDWCGAAGLDPQAAYAAMAAALRASGRPTQLAVSDWGLSRPWTWAAGQAVSWRTGPDLADCFDCAPRAGLNMVPPLPQGVMQALAQQAALAPPPTGHWADPDLLQAGRGNMTLGENQVQFSLWAMLGVPLMFASDPTGLASELRQMLADGQVIAIDRDTSPPATRLARTGDTEVWGRHLARGSWAVALLNRGPVMQTVGVTWAMLGLHRDQAVHDLWRGISLGLQTVGFSTPVPSHGVILLLLAPA